MSLYSGNNYLTKVILVSILVVERRSKMKKLMVVAVIGMLLVGCGAIPDDTYFQNHFQYCVEMCQSDHDWLTQCPGILEGQPLPDVMDCVRVQDDCRKISNAVCFKKNNIILNAIKSKNCNEWIDDALTYGAERVNGIPYNCYAD
jgi:hypothetical protein